jgi:hypothetical protein
LDHYLNYVLLFFRDSVLLKTGNWVKKIDVKRALLSEDLSINLISSDFGKLADVMKT